MNFIFQKFYDYCADDDLAAVYLVDDGGTKKWMCKTCAHMAKLFTNDCGITLPLCRDVFIAAARMTDRSDFQSLNPFEKKDGHYTLHVFVALVLGSK